MASGPTGGGNDGTREIQRFSESKVYTRKTFKGAKKNVSNTTAAAAAEKATTTAASVEKATTSTVVRDNNSNENITATTTKSDSKANIHITATTATEKENTTTAPEQENPTTASEPENATTATEPENATTAPEQENATTAPEQENATTATEPENATTAPEQENATTAPEQENATSAPEQENATTAPKQENATTATEQENATTATEPENATTATEPENATTAPVEENTNRNENITTTASTENNISESITSTEEVKDSNNDDSNRSANNLPQVEPEQEQEVQLQTLATEDVNSVSEPEQELQLQAPAEDVNLVPEPEQELQLQIPAAEDVNLVPEPEQELQLQTPAAEDVNMVHEAELHLQTLADEDVNMVPVPEPQLQTSAAEDADSVPEPELEPQLQMLAAEDVNLAPETEQELKLQMLAAEDVNLAPETEQEPQMQVLAAEDGNSMLQQEQEQLVSQRDETADDPSSLNLQQVLAPSAQEPGNGPVKQRFEGRIKLNLGSVSGSRPGSKQELRRKLEIELDKVRKLVKRIEAKEGETGGGFSHSHVSVNEVLDNGANRVHSELALAGVRREAARPLNHLSVSVLENSQGPMSDTVEKEKRTPKANPYYRNSEFLLAKDKFPPAESNKKSKLNGKKHGGSELGNGIGMGTKFFKSCSSLLEKLMKHKHGWVFNSPVDAKALMLHDYHIIIKHPMDLGTVKSRLNKNWYKSPKEFAEDVRLTFSNAMTYNPKGQDVHVMAEQLSKIFEDRWAIIESDYNREMRFHQDYEASLPTPTSRYAPHPLPLSLTRPAPLDMRRILDRSESLSHSFGPRPKPVSTTPSSRTPAPKKPKAKDPNKRDMTFEEKQKLSTNLQSLPSEKLDNIVQIIKKRNSAVLQHDDEIEVDIDRVDAETLWELDRFVTNYKKGLSKNKRKAELAIQAGVGAGQNAQERNPPQVVAAPPKEIRTDERNVSASSPVQGAKEGDNVSGSSSSSSSSSDSGSSSSDSDSDSSSASGSDAEQSPRS